MVATSFWSTDGKPISAEEFLNNLLGELPNLFKDEDELRMLWSNPQTRKTLLEKLDNATFLEQTQGLCPHLSQTGSGSLMQIQSNSPHSGQGLEGSFSLRDSKMLIIVCVLLPMMAK
jgi:hypothetical protein